MMKKDCILILDFPFFLYLKTVCLQILVWTKAWLLLLFINLNWDWLLIVC